MSHTIRAKAQLLKRVRRIGGQVAAVERALEAELGCVEVLQLIASIRGAVNGLTAEVMEEHIRNHVLDPVVTGAGRGQGADELVGIIRTYLK